MGIWLGFVELLQAAIFGISHFYGGSLGAAIVTFSLLARLGLMPWTVRIALRARSHARRVAVIQPELKRVREQWRDDAPRMLLETRSVYERQGLSPVDVGVLKGSLLQAPLFLGLYQAIRGAIASGAGSQRFLWITSLGRPSIGVAVITAAFVGAASLAGGASSTQPSWVAVLPMLIMLIVVVNLSAGFGLYLASSSLAGLLQGLIVRRVEARRGHAC